MTITPGLKDFIIYQGATWRHTLTWKTGDVEPQPVDLTGYSARMKACRRNSTNATPFIALTTENGGITLGGSEGTITLQLSAQATAALNENGVYDLELEDGNGVVTRLLMGSIVISKEITQ